MINILDSLISLVLMRVDFILVDTILLLMNHTVFSILISLAVFFEYLVTKSIIEDGKTGFHDINNYISKDFSEWKSTHKALQKRIEQP